MNQQVSRRSLVAATAVAVIPAITGAGIASTPTGSTNDAILELIADHKWKLEASDEAWNALGDLQEAFKQPIPKVRVGWLLKGRTDDGEDIKEPIYRYSEEEIEKWCARDLHQLKWCRTDEGREKLIQRYQERVNRLSTELRQQEAAVEAAELACGITAARTTAIGASDDVDRALNAVLSANITTIAEVQQIAVYVLECQRKEVEGFCDLEDHIPGRLVERLAGLVFGKATQI